MLKPKSSSKFLAASAAAAALTLALPSAAGAQSPSACDSYARDVAARETPGRGLIGGAVGLVEGALTLGASYEARWRAVYNAAFGDCVEGDAALVTTDPSVEIVEPDDDVAVVVPESSLGLVAPAPSNRVAIVTAPEPWTPEWYSYCAAKYRSFDPSTGQFLSYSGEYMFCR